MATTDYYNHTWSAVRVEPDVCDLALMMIEWCGGVSREHTKSGPSATPTHSASLPGGKLLFSG